MEIKTSLLLQCVPPKSTNTTHEPHLPLIRTARGPCKDTGNIFAKREISACPFVVLSLKKRLLLFTVPSRIIEAPHLTRQYKLPKIPTITCYVTCAYYTDKTKLLRTRQQHCFTAKCWNYSGVGRIIFIPIFTGRLQCFPLLKVSGYM